MPQPDSAVTRYITIDDRQVQVQAPEFSQLFVVQEMERQLKALDGRLAAADGDPETLKKINEQLVRMGVRILRVMQGLMVDWEDYEWLNDELAGRVLTMEHVAKALLDTIAAFNEVEPNRVERRKARAKRT